MPDNQQLPPESAKDLNDGYVDLQRLFDDICAKLNALRETKNLAQVGHITELEIIADRLRRGLDKVGSARGRVASTPSGGGGGAER